jgi:adenylate cyclase
MGEGMLDSSRVCLAVVGSGADKKSVPANENAVELVRHELRRILNSPHFDTSDRNRRFLEYVVEETLAGRHDRIKAYTIATIVFGREDCFDPTLDPVVRMEARRLRRSLERFYLVEGEVGAVRLELPKGGYVPKFQNPAAVTPVSGQSPLRPPASWPSRNPSILIDLFGAQPQSLACFCDGLARRIAVGVSRFPELRLFVRLSGCRDLESGSTASVPTVDFVLSGDLAASRNVLRITATLLHATSGEVVWAQTLVGDVGEELPDPRDQMAELIAGEVCKRMMAFDDRSRSPPGSGRALLSRVV